MRIIANLTFFLTLSTIGSNLLKITNFNKFHILRIFFLNFKVRLTKIINFQYISVNKNNNIKESVFFTA